MPIYQFPGVYVEEVDFRAKPIEGVATSVAGFVGRTRSGPVDTPVRISHWGQFKKIYSDPCQPGSGPFMEGAFLPHAVHGFFENGGSRCWVVRVGGASSREMSGDAAERRGLGALAAIDEITMVCMPDAVGLARTGDEEVLAGLQAELIAHCENAGNRLAILDCPRALAPRELIDWRTSGLRRESKDAALYYPWLQVEDPLTDGPLLVPPSGHVAGVWCRTDAAYGVHCAPTGGVLGAVGLESDVAESDQPELDESGVSSIRAVPRRGIRVWGARTLSGDVDWRCVSARRLFIHLAQSIDRGTRWAVLGPNDQRLWEEVQDAVTHFLDRSWRAGALPGESASDAYYVKCDAETNPPELIDAGQLTCEIGIAPAKPREFAVLRLIRLAGVPRSSRAVPAPGRPS